jgi:signal transduction histidine kinase/ActR/RegA family two-component response regulator
MALMERSVGQTALDIVLNALTEIVFFTDGEGTLTFANAPAGERFGLDKYLGVPLFDAPVPVTMSSPDGPSVPPGEHPVRRVLATHQPVTGFKLSVKVGDDRFWYVMNTVPLWEGGRFAGTASVLHDVTIATRLETELADHAARLEAIVNLVNDSVFVIGADGKLLFANAVGQELLGLPDNVGLEERARRLQLRDVDDVPVPPAMFPSSRALAGATLSAAPYGITDARGEFRRVVAGAHPLRRPDGSVYAALVTMHDITDELRGREELEAAREAAEEANRLKDEFMAALSHELRAPLQPILGWTEVLRRHRNLDAVTAQALDVIGRNIRQQVRLVDDLLDLSRIVHGKLALRLETFDIREQIRAAAESFEGAATQKNVRLRVSLPEELVLMWGDAARIHQIATNLISNAVKFTPAGGQVAVQLVAGGAQALLEVEDTGEGIAPDDLAVIFEPFRQAGGSSRRGGLGLGLNLARRLTELHGGSVEVFSEGLGYGSRFQVRLPLAPRPTEPAAAPAPAGRLLENRTILVIDDNSDTREVLKYMLEVEGARVETADGGRAGVRTARRFRPQIVLCDVGLPDIDGLEVARRVRRVADLRGARLIALTGYGQAEDVRQALEAGFEAHLTKPINLDQLLTLLAGREVDREETPPVE